MEIGVKKRHVPLTWSQSRRGPRGPEPDVSTLSAGTGTLALHRAGVPEDHRPTPAHLLPSLLGGRSPDTSTRRQWPGSRALQRPHLEVEGTVGLGALLASTQH